METYESYLGEQIVSLSSAFICSIIGFKMSFLVILVNWIETEQISVVHEGLDVTCAPIQLFNPCSFVTLDGQACQVVLWDESLHPKDLAAGPVTVRMTWREYQNLLTQRCWQINVNPKSNSGCSSIYHSEWSKLALFDFLLQVKTLMD